MKSFAYAAAEPRALCAYEFRETRNAGSACDMKSAELGAYIFDFDGTLGESMYIWDELPARLVRECGATPPADLLRIIEPMVYEDAMRYISRELLPGWDAELLSARLLGMVRHEYEHVVEPKPGAVEALRALRGTGARICIVSATDSAMVRAALRRFGVEELFEFVLFADEYGGKAYPECYLEAARRLGAEPGAVAVFEDALHALRTAKRAGFYTVGLYDSHSAENWPDLRREADESYTDIGEWLRASR